MGVYIKNPNKIEIEKQERSTSFSCIPIRFVDPRSFFLSSILETYDFSSAFVSVPSYTQNTIVFPRLLW